MKGLNTDNDGTGIPGGLDAIGSEAEKLFLPMEKRTPAEVKYLLSKLEYDYKRREDQIKAWASGQITLADDNKQKNIDNLEVLKDRTSMRLQGAVDKTKAYQKTVKKLAASYQKRYRDRQINRFQWEQIRTWAKGKLALSRSRFNAFKARVVSKYESTLARQNAVRQRKRTQKVDAMKLAQDQRAKNRAAYQIAKKRIQLQGQVRGDSVWGLNGKEAFGMVPTLGVQVGSDNLDPKGDLNLSTRDPASL